MCSAQGAATSRWRHAGKSSLVACGEKRWALGDREKQGAQFLSTQWPHLPGGQLQALAWLCSLCPPRCRLCWSRLRYWGSSPVGPSQGARARQMVAAV